jgi:hypothetical protein
LNKEAQTKGKFVTNKDKELAVANQRFVDVILQLHQLKASEENWALQLKAKEQGLKQMEEKLTAVQKKILKEGHRQ